MLDFVSMGSLRSRQWAFGPSLDIGGFAASLAPFGRVTTGPLARHWALRAVSGSRWSRHLGLWPGQWALGGVVAAVSARLEPHPDHCRQRTTTPPRRQSYGNAARRSGLCEIPTSLERLRFSSRDRLPFPLVTADPVGQPLPSAVPTYGTPPPVGRESVPTGCTQTGAYNFAIVPGKAFLAEGIPFIDAAKPPMSQ